MSDDNGDQNMSRDEMPTPDSVRKPRGFAAMDPSRVSELAKRGGRAAQKAGTAHQFTSEEARAAGRKGGVAMHARRKRSDTEKSS